METGVAGRRRVLGRDWSAHSKKTIHRERNGVPVSSDDSSDDDDLRSRTSQASKMTIHREANGIWVSSDEESDRETEVKRNAKNWHARPTQNQYNWRNPTPPTNRYLSIDSSVQSKAALKPSPASQWSSGSSVTLANYSSSSGSDDTGSTIRRRPASQVPNQHERLRGEKNKGYESFESISLSSDHGYMSASTYGSRRSAAAPAPFITRLSSTPEYKPVETTSSLYKRYATLESCAEQTAPSLHSFHFWDHDGRKALVAERGIQLVGFLSFALLVAHGQYFYSFILLFATVMGSSYFSTTYRLLRWRGHSGIVHQALFNDLYEIVEQVATDTRIPMPTGEMRARLVCAGELGQALSRNEGFAQLDPFVKLRFWVEACVHFRLTLRNGCHHLGNGKLPTRSMTSAALGMVSSHIPCSICTSCDNKIAIESRFPLKCD